MWGGDLLSSGFPKKRDHLSIVSLSQLLRWSLLTQLHVTAVANASARLTRRSRTVVRLAPVTFHVPLQQAAVARSPYHPQIMHPRCYTSGRVQNLHVFMCFCTINIRPFRLRPAVWFPSNRDVGAVYHQIMANSRSNAGWMVWLIILDRKWPQVSAGRNRSFETRHDEFEPVTSPHSPISRRARADSARCAVTAGTPYPGKVFSRHVYWPLRSVLE
jgi:hypothetical protein